MGSFGYGWTVICVATQKKIMDRDEYLITIPAVRFTKTVMEWILDVFSTVVKVRGQGCERL